MNIAKAELSATAMARLLRMTPRRLQQLAAEGHAVRSGRGKYELLGTVHGYLDALTSRTSIERFREERAGHERVKRELAELELAQKRRELVPDVDVERSLIAVTSPIAMRLDALPLRAPEMRACLSDAEAENRLREIVHQMRSEIADLAERYRDEMLPPEGAE
jgi:phage terminase Nu1 subunit (DNA packaging protein)